MNLGTLLAQRDYLMPTIGLTNVFVWYKTKS